MNIATPTTDVRARYVSPSVKVTAFNCPHCGTLAKQFWYSAYADALKKDATPLVLGPEKIDELTFKEVEPKEERAKLRRWVERLVSGRPFLEPEQKYADYHLQNISLSRCFDCDDIAIWIHDRLVWPRRGEAPLPNPDLSKHVREDYEEASTILDLSPRGAAALLRLALQKLCRELGEKGKNINDDIAALVEKGLDAKVAQALDIVRVIGNNAVHPGQIDLKDDRATAETLFRLINLIAERMISEAKHVNEVFDTLPEEARKAILARDAKKKP